MTSSEDVLAISPVIPVVTLTRVEDGPQLARTLRDAGIGIIEITLRSPAALAAIEAVRTQVPEMCVGAGTVWTEDDLNAAKSAGAGFIVSPGSPDAVLDAIGDLPYLPGAQTPTEVARLVARGINTVKFFPAGPAGGVAALRSLTAVFPDTLFCPTGGISARDAADYLALTAVPCVGGSWITPAKLLAAQDWETIGRLARAAYTGDAM